MGHSPEYKMYITSADWYAKSKSCQRLTKGYCVLFPWRKSRHCHHMTYKNFKHERPLRDTVPLCKTAHSIIHWKVFWKSPLRPWINWMLRFLMVVWVLLGLLRK